MNGAPPDLSRPLEGITVRQLQPKKLLHSKWTAVHVVAREKHFLVTRVMQPEQPDAPIEWIDIEAVHSQAVRRIAWQELTDAARWHQGWV
ncbi:tryptophan-rich hypothetical protein [Actimicrobium sp. GrIS 1.19]|uniref:TIGR02450 family Trp-rich protein n=1 Tax=Actimicrobium sp. GrIS 1.19 TaxID=3071708 RepID=UPI002E0AB07A|nr:tryptophan-rich hypothetical protein [Actimicrobium sp. GrIS 1.19]